MTDTPKPITTPVAKLQGFGPSETEQVIAELLEALRECRAALIEWDTDYSAYNQLANDAIHAANTAIARAEAR
jgi:hypothetical protein